MFCAVYGRNKNKGIQILWEKGRGAKLKLQKGMRCCRGEIPKCKRTKQKGSLENMRDGMGWDGKGRG